MPKSNLSDERRKWIRDNFHSIDPATLTPDELYYYNKIKAGYIRAKKAVRFEGRFIGGEILDILRAVAKRKNVSLKEYLTDNSEQVHNFLNTGSTTNHRRPDSVNDIIENSRRRYVYIKDGNGIVRHTKADAIARVADLMQFVSSSQNITGVALPITVTASGSISITVPDVQEVKRYYKTAKRNGYEEDFDDFMCEVFDELDIEYYKS